MAHEQPDTSSENTPKKKKDVMVAINLSNAQKLFTNITQSGIRVILLD